MNRTSQHPSGLAGPPGFLTTQWSRIAIAADVNAPGSRQAFAELCQRYWYPLYAFLRKRGLSQADAQDVTQSFFLHLLEKNPLDHLTPERGRFRNFLLTSLSNFLANKNRADRARIRGGGEVVKSLDIDFRNGELRLAIDPSDSESPESYFLRQWALDQLQQAIVSLGNQYERRGQGRLFEQLRPGLAQDFSEQEYLSVASDLGLSLGATRVALFRLRQRYRETLRSIIGQTVATEEEIDEEIQELLSALGSKVNRISIECDGMA